MLTQFKTQKKLPILKNGAKMDLLILKKVNPLLKNGERAALVVPKNDKIPCIIK